MKKHVVELEEFNTEAMQFGRSLLPQGERATLVTLSGELGAGKTAFTKALAQSFGIEEIVNSPTFVLEKIYTLPEGQNFKRLIHIDAYRLESGAELAPLGLKELMKDPDNLIFLEWPEKVVGALPQASQTISFAVHSDGSRTILYG
jgi:tRNA threonylcarbamoyladenosine biosynthesis protein TsaE